MVPMMAVARSHSRSSSYGDGGAFGVVILFILVITIISIPVVILSNVLGFKPIQLERARYEKVEIVNPINGQTVKKLEGRLEICYKTKRHHTKIYFYHEDEREGYYDKFIVPKEWESYEIRKTLLPEFREE